MIASWNWWHITPQGRALMANVFLLSKVWASGHAIPRHQDLPEVPMADCLLGRDPHGPMSARPPPVREWLTNHPGHRLKPSSSPYWNQALLALKRVGARIHHAFPYRREDPGLNPHRHAIVHNGQVVTTRLYPQDRPPIRPRLLELLPPSIRIDLKELWKDVYHPILSAKVSNTLWRVLHCSYRTGDRTGPTFQHQSCPRCVEPNDSHLHRFFHCPGVAAFWPKARALLHAQPWSGHPVQDLMFEQTLPAIWTIHNSFLRAAFDQQVWTLPHMITHFQVHFEMALKVCTMSPTLPAQLSLQHGSGAQTPPFLDASSLPFPRLRLLGAQA
ncbi:hypothetical protein L0F63_006401, partial [Massospora cicadina]